MAMFDSIDGLCVYSGDEVLGNILQLLEQARSSGTLVVFIQHTDSDDLEYTADTPSWQLHPSPDPRSDEQVIRKSTPDSFHDTPLHNELQKMGVARLVIVGMQTDFCVNATCRRAPSLGYDIVIAKDAHTTFDGPNQAAQEIIGQHNRAWSEFARLLSTDETKL